MTRTALERATRENATTKKRSAANSLALTHDLLDQCNIVSGPIAERVRELIGRHHDAIVARVTDADAHAAVLRDRDADAAMLQRDIRELLQPPTDVDLGPISSVKCLVDAYATLRAEMRKTQPAVVVAVEGALWRAWGGGPRYSEQFEAEAMRTESMPGTRAPEGVPATTSRITFDLFDRSKWPQFAPMAGPKKPLTGRIEL